MKYALAALSLALLIFAVAPWVSAWKAGSAAERSFSIRFTAFVWLIGLLIVAAFVFLPNKGRVVMAVPVFLGAVMLAKWWKTSRTRLRREAELQSNFERARPIN